MTPRNWWNVQNFDDDKKWPNLSMYLKDVYNILVKGITPQDNFRGALLEVEFDSANTDTKIRHGLSFVPSNYFVVGLSVEMVIYDGDTDNTLEFMYLQSSAIGTARVFVF